MGLWGAAQAIGFALGGLFGAAASDLARALLGAPGPAYASVFLLEGLMFVAAAALAARIGSAGAWASRPRLPDDSSFAGEMPGLQTGATR
jgi:BCD family chlorophyll transporter-like MFS transporter